MCCVRTMTRLVNRFAAVSDVVVGWASCMDGGWGSGSGMGGRSSWGSGMGGGWGSGSGSGGHQGGGGDVSWVCALVRVRASRLLFSCLIAKATHSSSPSASVHHHSISNKPLSNVFVY